MQNHRGKTCDWGTDTFQTFCQPDTPGASSSGGGGRGIDMRPHFLMRSQKGEGKTKGSKKGKDDTNEPGQASEKKSQEHNEKKDCYAMGYYGQGDKREGPPGNFEPVEDACGLS